MIFRNKKEFKKTFLQYYTPLCNFANNIVKSRATAEDTVQEVFLHLWEQNETLIINEDIKDYLFKSVRNKVFEFLRFSKTYEKHVALAMEENVRLSGVEEIADLYMKLDRINNSLRHLPSKCRNVFVLHKFNGLTYAEIAEYEKISVKTVENHMYKALKILRKHLNIEQQ